MQKINAKETKIALFGFDIIIDDHTGNYGIIDLNYMPSYAGVLNHFGEHLTEVLETFRREKIFSREIMHPV